MCEGPRRAGSPGWQRAAPARLSRSRAAGTVLSPASAASAAKARGFSCPNTKYVGATSTSIVLKSQGVLRVGPPGYFKRAATSPTSSLDTYGYRCIYANPCGKNVYFTALLQLPLVYNL